MRRLAKHPMSTLQPTSAKSVIPDRTRSCPSGGEETIQQLQRTLGNRAVRRSLESVRGDADSGKVVTDTARSGPLCSRMPVRAITPNGTSPARVVQRYAFVNEKQVKKSEKGLTP